MLLKRVIQAFARHRLKFALVGGYAVALHGAVRGTVDIDLVISLNQKAYRAAEKALASIGLAPRLPISADDVFHFRDEYIDKRNLTAWSFVNPENPLEVVDILITEDLKKLDTVTKAMLGSNVRIASIEELIRMKKLSARPQDLADIEALEKLR